MPSFWFLGSLDPSLLSELLLHMLGNGQCGAPECEAWVSDPIFDLRLHCVSQSLVRERAHRRTLPVLVSC